MKKNSFYIKAIWDDDAEVFYSESDIIGLHIEAETLDEFKAVMLDLAREMILANHITKRDLAKKKLTDLIPAIHWQGPAGIAAA